MSSLVNGSKASSKQSMKTYSVSRVSKTVGVSPRQLYYWESLGIVKPQYMEYGVYAYRHYSESDVALLVKIKSFMDQGYTLRASVQKTLGDCFYQNKGGRRGKGATTDASGGS